MVTKGNMVNMAKSLGMVGMLCAVVGGLGWWMGKRYEGNVSAKKMGVERWDAVRGELEEVMMDIGCLEEGGVDQLKRRKWMKCGMCRMLLFGNVPLERREESRRLKRQIKEFLALYKKGEWRTRVGRGKVGVGDVANMVAAMGEDGDVHVFYTVVKGIEVEKKKVGYLRFGKEGEVEEYRCDIGLRSKGLMDVGIVGGNVYGVFCVGVEGCKAGEDVVVVVVRKGKEEIERETLLEGVRVRDVAWRGRMCMVVGEDGKVRRWVVKGGERKLEGEETESMGVDMREVIDVDVDASGEVMACVLRGGKGVEIVDLLRGRQSWVEIGKGRRAKEVRMITGVERRFGVLLEAADYRSIGVIEEKEGVWVFREEVIFKEGRGGRIVTDGWCMGEAGRRGYLVYESRVGGFGRELWLVEKEGRKGKRRLLCTGFMPIFARGGVDDRLVLVYLGGAMVCEGVYVYRIEKVAGKIEAKQGDVME